MNLRLFLDEDTQDTLFIKLLRDYNFNVSTVNEVNLSGQKDSIIFKFSKENNRILLTHNCKDFKQLHQEHLIHPGILGIYKNKDLTKNMGFRQIIQAINRARNSLGCFDNQFISVNEWNY